MFAQFISSRAVLSALSGIIVVPLCLLATAGEASAQQVEVVAPPPGQPGPPPRYEDERDRDRDYGFMIGVDGEGVVPINMPQLGDGNSFQGGGGFKVRLGERIRLTRHVELTPEVGYGYDHLFTSDNQGDAYSWEMHRLFAGARLGFGHILVPSIYGHLGYGWRDTGDPTISNADGGLAYDVGAALDLRLLHVLGFGVHAEYAGLNVDGNAPRWLALGAHLELTL